MVDVSDDANGRGYRRVEVLTGPGRCRRWSEEAKARIVAETLAPGAVIAEVARRWQVCSQHVFTWRREMRHSVPPSFVPIVAEPSPAPRGSTPSPCIEIQVAGALVRVLPDTDPALLVMVLRALRASAA
jgi:transposase